MGLPADPAAPSRRSSEGPGKHWPLAQGRPEKPGCGVHPSNHDSRTSRRRPSTSPSFKAARQISEREPWRQQGSGTLPPGAGKPGCGQRLLGNPGLCLYRPHLHSPVSPRGPTRGQALEQTSPGSSVPAPPTQSSGPGPAGPGPLQASVLAGEERPPARL